MGMRAKTARVIRDGVENRIYPSNGYRSADVIIVRPGEKIPVDGRVVRRIDEYRPEHDTGESLPVTRTIGDEVIGATINKQGNDQGQGDTCRPRDNNWPRSSAWWSRRRVSKAPINGLSDQVAAVLCPP